MERALSSVLGARLQCRPNFGLLNKKSTFNTDPTINMSITFKLEKDGKKWHAYCPELHGCHTFGSTKEEALKNLKDVVRLYMEAEGENAIIRSAEIEGQIVGFCTVAIRDSLWQESSMGHICELIVDEKFRGKKIGKSERRVREIIKCKEQYSCKSCIADEQS